jgi:hypothetical protein
MMHEQYNFEPAEIVECSQKEVPGRRAMWLWTCVWGVHIFWYHNHGRICIPDGKYICVVDIDLVSCEVHLVHNWLILDDVLSFPPFFVYDILRQSPVEVWWHTMHKGRGGGEGETLPQNMVYPALLPLMRTRLPVVNWTDTPDDLNGLVHFTERRNLVSACVPSHFRCSLHHFTVVINWILKCNLVTSSVRVQNSALACQTPGKEKYLLTTELQFWCVIHCSVESALLWFFVLLEPNE